MTVCLAGKVASWSNRFGSLFSSHGIDTPAVSSRSVALLLVESSVFKTPRDECSNHGSATEAKGCVFLDVAFTGLGLLRWRGNDGSIRSPALTESLSSDRVRMALEGLVTSILMTFRDEEKRVVHLLLSFSMSLTCRFGC